MTTFFILTALILGIILGFFLAHLTLWIVKIKCPKCKKLKPIKEIVLFNWKSRSISGKHCQKCSKPQKETEIY